MYVNYRQAFGAVLAVDDNIAGGSPEVLSALGVNAPEAASALFHAICDPFLSAMEEDEEGTRNLDVKLYEELCKSCGSFISERFRPKSPINLVETQQKMQQALGGLVRAQENMHKTSGIIEKIRQDLMESGDPADVQTVADIEQVQKAWADAMGALDKIIGVPFSETDHPYYRVVRKMNLGDEGDKGEK